MNKRKRNRLLLADTSIEYRRSVIGFLELEGLVVQESSTFEDAQKRLVLGDFELVLVELRMQDANDPNDMSGLEIAKFASERDIPCIILTAIPKEDVARLILRSDNVESLAKDLITKASGPQALLDSINLVLSSKDAKLGKVNLSSLVLDLARAAVWKNGELLQLSRNQYVLLKTLYEKDGGVCTYEELIKEVYSESLTYNEARKDRRLRNLVDRIKEKLEDTENSNKEYLENIPGKGFKLNVAG